MTDPHPLTDEMIDEITDELSIFSENMMAFLVKDCMRADYTKGSVDMLEKVFEWIRENLSDDYYGLVNGDEVLSDLKKAMGES